VVERREPIQHRGDAKLGTILIEDVRIVLRSCPSCQGDNIDIIDHGDHEWQFVCLECGFDTEHWTGLDWLIETWNHRY